ncbi:hypothetical protein [Acetivibrio ethanolgignens]|uniref:ABC transporter permease n=1 Tax=Acetivibrio ethanolgignens TaxID=290052 RepID=A0A0V8QGG8_9FIRM|nr:hypothetical protein [Acetivibrio ethanolgignens]KSV59616.1 hypothetical protein ASU35_01080 [Acetivibrio ethanolgignens]
MNQKLSLNLLTVGPFALWGYIALGLSRMRDMIPSEQRLDTYIISVFVYLIFVFYYTLLILYLKKDSIDNVKYQKYCIACLVIGFVFLASSLVF